MYKKILRNNLYEIPKKNIFILRWFWYIPFLVIDIPKRLLSLVGQASLTIVFASVVIITGSPIGISHNCIADCEINTILLASCSDIFLGSSAD